MIGRETTSEKRKISLFQVPRVSASNGDNKKRLNQTAREECLLLRSRETLKEIKKKMGAKSIFDCARHFKP